MTTVHEFYRGLASLLRAGVVMSEALTMLRANGTLKQRLGDELQHTVSGGAPLSVAMADHPDHFPVEDVALVEAGETSGRLEQTLDRIAMLEEERRLNRSSFLTEAWYPILLVHLAAVMLPIGRRAAAGDLTFGNVLGDALLVLGPLYLIFFTVRSLNRNAQWRTRFRWLLDRLPGFGNAARRRRRASFANVLEATYSAGIPIDRCLSLAGRAADVAGADEASKSVAAGEQLAPAVARTGLLDDNALSRLRTGEQAGEISGTLRSIAIEENEQAREIMRRSMTLVSTGIYLLVALWIVSAVIAFYMAYLDQIDRVLDF